MTRVEQLETASKEAARHAEVAKRYHEEGHTEYAERRDYYVWVWEAEVKRLTRGVVTPMPHGETYA